MAENGKTIKEIVEGMTEEQRNALYVIVGTLMKNDQDKKEEGDKDMKHNIFDAYDNENNETELSHEDMKAIFADASRIGSLKESFLQHGITNIDYLFPDHKDITKTPRFIDRDQGWVSVVMNGVHHTPFSRIKSTFADITADEARAKGYIKGNEKTDEVFVLLKRTTDPTTIYKKQSFHRDDLLDIVDIDAAAWVKSEMRGKLDEELARAILIGDGRLAASDDKIAEDKIRPIWKDDSLYTYNKVINFPVPPTDDQKAKAFIKGAIKARKHYKGSGNPVMFMTEDLLTDCLLLEDGVGRTLYDDEDKLARKLRVSKIVTVPVMENQSRTVDTVARELGGILVNLNDYNAGADKGGAVSMFDDFDIDYNKQKYLIETRCSGALVVPYSAITIEFTYESENEETDPNQ